MKKKSNDMSVDMFNDATSSTPIPVFTTATEEGKDDVPQSFSKVPLVSKVPNDVPIQNELIKNDFDSQTVSARALYDFFAPTERFYPWCTRYFSFGLTANIDFTAAKFFLSVNNGAKQDIGDYLLTVDAAKHIAMVQRSEKGKQARQYFINIEKLYFKSVIANNQKPETPSSLVENFKKLLVQLETEIIQNQQVKKDHDFLAESLIVLEKQITQHHDLQNLKGQYIEKNFIQKVDKALKETFTEADKIVIGSDFVDTLPRAANPSDKEITNILPHIYKMWYFELPDVFSTPDAERIGLKYDISRTTLFRLLRNQVSKKPIFRKLRYGKYQKLHIDF